jgi:uncharacterized protein (UPF0548 family)
VLLLHKPAPEEIDKLLPVQSAAIPAYKEVGITRDGKSPAQGYRDHKVSGKLGRGQQTFIQAVEGLKNWKHFSLSWLFIRPEKPPIEVGTTLVVCASHAFLWSVNACRILYVIDEQQENRGRFGYGYGTLPNHVEQGEERFLVEWNQDTDEVTYEIFAFSRPNHILVSTLWPLAIAIQDKFRRDSLEALQAALN